ncbi:MAG: BMP family ABC transporter substrate-binding protein [Oscillospiraceae bacterium]|jgi:basic membrane lipoprotein Med (substrate-binding protein (PBP1-ABC) superfamily)|nr:BMP family ABC transporter substrate-binding protein [Oscillospiraceae bacterium]
MTDYYLDALKRGQREFRTCVSQGEHPYLPRLDDFLPSERIAGGMPLGIVHIPSELIVGTRTAGRTNAFSRGFMPLLDAQSEFGLKWKSLCQAHLEEGIRDPIKAYEYLNRFYVEEGNKRVSVLKFFDAVTITAQVTRIMPERNGSKEVELYYEFAEFYQASRLNILEFSKPGSYAAIQRLMGKRPGDPWTEEERRDFTAAYYYFRQAYEANRGSQLASTVGDAMLAYIKIYGFGELQGKDGAELKKQLAKVWEEIRLQQEELPISVKLTPEEKDQGILSKVLPKSAPKKLKAAFIHDKTPSVSGWTYGHELGRQHINRVFGEELETAAYFNAMDDDPQKVIEEAIADGNTVLFTTSPRLLPASLRAAIDHPDIIILNCSLNKSHRYIRTYYARMYEAKFIMGAIAGSLAGGNHVGFICDYPIFGQVAGINAFALGVQMTNPRSKVYLDWSAVGSIAAATKRLTDQGICLISSIDLPKQGEKDPRFGLSLVNGEKQVNLAIPLWKWGAYYEQILRQIRDRTFQSEYKESSKALNYYWGMASNVIGLQCSGRLPDSSRKLASMLKAGICAGTVDPFQGPLYAQGGQVISQPQQTLSPEQIINMDWLAENISGSIPAYEELTPVGKETVNIVGIDSPEAAPGV